MRILCLNNSSLVKYGLAEGFVELKQEVMVMGLWQYNNQVEILYRVIEEWKPQIVFFEGFPGFNYSLVPAIKKDFGHLLKIFYWAIEDPINTSQSDRLFISYVDYVFTTCKELIPHYRELGKPCDVLLFGCLPTFHRKWHTKPEYITDIVLVACNYDKRFEKTFNILLNPILEKGYKIHVWGNYWDDPNRKYNLLKYPEVIKGRLAYEELPSCYSSAKIVLGVNQIWDSETQTSMRPYEVMGCGAFYLGYYTFAQEKLFVKGKHMEWSNSPEETIQLVEYYLKNDEARQNIARWGQEEVYQHHTYIHRAIQILADYFKEFLPDRKINDYILEDYRKYLPE